MKNFLRGNTFLSSQHALLIAAAGNLVLFTAVILLGFPVFHSGDEFNMAWLLGDGYGAGATTCLPFLHNQHYWLSAPVKWLFQRFPDINWFSWSMILTQYASMAAIYFVLLRTKRWQTATGLFTTLFIVYGSFLLVYLHNSSTAATATTAGILLCWYSFSQSSKPRLLAAAFVFFLLGTLFRLHVAFPIMVVAAPFFLLLPGKKKFIAAGFMIGCLLISFLCFWIQNNHYTSNCPNWQTEENYRQAKYANINYYRNTNVTALEKYQLQTELLNNLILPDTGVVPASVLQTIANESRTRMPLKTFLSLDTWYWPFVNNRLYLAGAILLFCLTAVIRQKWLYGVLSLLAAMSIVIFLVVYMKLPEFMIPALLFTSCSFISVITDTGVFSAQRKILAFTAALTLVCWGVVRTGKTGIVNERFFNAFKQVQQELAAYPDKLFISTGENDVFFYVSVFATPKEYSLQNILFIDQPESIRKETLQNRFAYTGFNTAILNPNVYFRGPEIPAITKYYELQTGRAIKWEPAPVNFKYSGIYKPIPLKAVIPASK